MSSPPVGSHRMPGYKVSFAGFPAGRCAMVFVAWIYPDVVLLWSRRGLDVVQTWSRCGPQGFQMCLDETGKEFERDDSTNDNNNNTY